MVDDTESDYMQEFQRSTCYHDLLNQMRDGAQSQLQKDLLNLEQDEQSFQNSIDE
jgi:hypothetical protein